MFNEQFLQLIRLYVGDVCLETSTPRYIAYVISYDSSQVNQKLHGKHSKKYHKPKILIDIIYY